MNLIEIIRPFAETLNASNVNDSRFDRLELDDIEITEDGFEASVSDFDGGWLQIEGGVREEETESLWGDQVSEVHQMAYAQENEISEVRQFDPNGVELPYVELRFLHLARPIVDEEEEELSSQNCSVDYNYSY
jgi:hypothetical protein